ncbi:hypothetical protein GYA27_04955 [candidate division WWE3 bacterium]|uniref:Transglutaminase-like domain-containing protein n=1 Tax=candidate division WWE3 bacterium TaxID=2053526 RepID=A0A7X9HHD0_UNCKA|nr:hypothetical protein [candidate division WWE3 bacterium]
MGGPITHIVLNEQEQAEETLLEYAKGEGDRTKVGENVLRVSKEIDPDNELNGLGIVEAVCSYVATMIPDKTTLEQFRKENPNLVYDKRERSADELLSAENLIPGHMRIRNTDGCNEFAHIARALLLSKGIPCLFTDTLQEEWLKNKSKSWASGDSSTDPVLGHIFLDVYIKEEDKWYTINPGNSDERVHEYGEYSIGGKRYINPISGKDSADIGFPTMEIYLEALKTALNEAPASETVRKDKLHAYRETLEANPEIRDKIVSVFSAIDTVPAIHITSRAFENKEGRYSSGFLENIQANGFREKDTNVGVFMKRDGTRHLAISDDFVNSPEKFLKELEILLNHYYHHGVRTNKNVLGNTQTESIGIPTMLIVDISDTKLIPGSDYEDHYKLGESVAGNKIIGEIDLEGIGPRIREELPRISFEFLNQIEKYIKT